MDITNYQIYLYNGFGGKYYGTPRSAGTLSGNIYFSVLDYPSNGIQNGAPDGIALVDGSLNVVEFLSYEGSFTATNGPASGMTSVDIGTSETSSTPGGYSLQRSGSGCQATDFTWQSPGAATKGSANTGQTISCTAGPPVPTTAIPTVAPSPPTTFAPIQPVSNLGVKLMTYNILAGGSTQNTDWKDVVKGENADIIVFTEVGNWDDNNDDLLDQYVSEFNAHFSAETPYEGNTVQGISFANSANAIMTRFPIVSTTQLTDEILAVDLAHDIMAWTLNVGNNKLVHVFGIHLKCCGGTENDDRRNDSMEALLSWIDANTAASDGVILMGDFNSVSPVDTDNSFPGYDSRFEPSSGSSLNDGPMRMLLDSADSRSSTVHAFKDAFREANPFCGSNASCCADTSCDSGLTGGCPERGYTYVGTSHNFDSRIDFIVVNQHVTVSGAATTGDIGPNICTASDHLPVDVIVDF